MRLLDKAPVLDRIPAKAVVAFALLLRLAYALKLGSRFYQIDEISFHDAARALAAAGSIPGVQPPVPTAFFSFFYALFGPDMLYARLGQAFAGAALVWLVGRLTEDVTGSKRAGKLALLLSSIYPFFVYYGGVLMSESLYLLLITLSFWQLVSGRAWLGGLSLGLAALCRIEGALIAPLVLAFIPRRKLFPAVLFWLLPLLVWGVRNRLSTGVFTVDAHGGMTLLHGTKYYSLDDSAGTAEVMKAVEASPVYQEALSVPPGERDAVYRREAVRWMLANPGETLRGWAKKFVSFWRFYPRPEKAYYQSEHSKPDVGLSRRALVGISLAFEPWLILLGLYGLWTLRFWPAWAFIVGTCGIHVLVVSMMRYRLPVTPFLILGACHVLDRLSRRSGSAR
jgi:4-amino-4-deoxy-L-arabinose transferase-like glycosyltransferase